MSDGAKERFFVKKVASGQLRPYKATKLPYLIKATHVSSLLYLAAGSNQPRAESAE